MPSNLERSARAATTVMFFLVGWIYAAWGTRIPAIKDDLDLADWQLGAAILGLEAGAIVGLSTGGVLVAKVGSRLTLRIGFVLFPIALITVAFAPGLGALAGCLALMAASNSIVDVAINAQGIELEHRYGRSILSGLHAGHPFGLVAGGVTGAAASAAAVPVTVHFAVAAVIAGVAALTATRWLVDEAGFGSQPVFVRPSGRLLLLGLIAFCAFLLDGAAYNWSAVHLAAERGAAEWLAATAFTLFALTLAVGRLFGDRLVARFGRVRVVQGCAAVAAAGSLLAILAPTMPATLLGWALFGLGLAPVAPTVIGAARSVSRGAPGVAIAAVTTIGYLGSFTGPPVIGMLAELSSLSAALGLLVIISVLTIALARPGLRHSSTQAAA